MSRGENAVTIIVAEDDVDDRFLIEDAFRENAVKHNLQFVEDGEELLELLRGTGRYAKESGDVTPTLVLLDLNMPKMDGREALKEIRSDGELNCIPVVILTTSISDDDINNAYSSGANSYIPKPASFDDMLQLTRVISTYWGDFVRQAPKTMTN